VHMHAELHVNFLNTCDELVKRLKKLWTHKLQLTYSQKDVPLPLILLFSLCLSFPR